MSMTSSGVTPKRVRLMLTPGQKLCLQELARGPMRGVKNAYRGFRAPNPNVSLLIMHDLAMHVPAAQAGEAPTYELTQKGAGLVRELNLI